MQKGGTTPLVSLTNSDRMTEDWNKFVYEHIDELGNGKGIIMSSPAAGDTPKSVRPHCHRPKHVRWWLGSRHLQRGCWLGTLLSVGYQLYTSQFSEAPDQPY